VAFVHGVVLNMVQYAEKVAFAHRDVIALAGATDVQNGGQSMRMVYGLSLVLLLCASADGQAQGKDRRKAIEEEIQTIVMSLSGSEWSVAKARLDGQHPERAFLPSPLNAGDIGRLSWENNKRFDWRVNQVVDDATMLVGQSRYWIEGVSTRNIVDDSLVSFEDISFVVKGTRQYETAGGGSNTVWHLVKLDTEKIDQAVVRIRELRRQERSHRTWKDSSGAFKVDGTFGHVDARGVTLVKDDGRIITVPTGRLSADDQKFVREEIRRRKKEDDDDRPIPNRQDRRTVKNGR
jgi:hypothetical protein